VASPIISGFFALVRPASPLGWAYANSGAFFDVTSGTNGACSGSYLCTGAIGFDGPTGFGSPNGALALTAPSTAATTTLAPTTTTKISTATTATTAAPGVSFQFTSGARKFGVTCSSYSGSCSSVQGCVCKTACFQALAAGTYGTASLAKGAILSLLSSGALYNDNTIHSTAPYVNLNGLSFSSNPNFNLYYTGSAYVLYSKTGVTQSSYTPLVTSVNYCVKIA